VPKIIFKQAHAAEDELFDLRRLPRGIERVQELVGLALDDALLHRFDVGTQERVVRQLLAHRGWNGRQLIP